MESWSEQNKKYLEGVFDFHAGSANYLMNIAGQCGVCYLEVPKVACSTVKKSLQTLEGKLLDVELHENVHDKNASPLQSPLDVEVSLEDLLRDSFVFTFVRNPFLRVLSCYLDKVDGGQWERNIRMPKLGLSPKVRISFVEFLQIVKSQSSFDMDIHWMPQALLLGSGRVKIDYVGRFECFSQAFLATLGFIRRQLPEDKRQQIEGVEVDDVRWHSTGSANKIDEFYNAEAIALVQEIYQQDFQSFGYSNNPHLV